MGRCGKRGVSPAPWAVLAAMLFLCAGCAPESTAVDVAGAESAMAAASLLRQRYPEQAAHVLGREEGFVATESGFLVERGGGVVVGRDQAVDIELPREGDGVARLRTWGGFEARVREVGMAGEGALTERAVVYSRAGGSSFWSAVPGGVEEWLLLEAGAARDGEVVAAWEVEGARLRQAGDVVLLEDPAGWVRLQVTAPAAFAASGREVPVRLHARGTRIELFVDAGGEAVLVDPDWTAADSMSFPRMYHTATLLGDGKVLVAGGASNGVLLDSADVYDPSSDMWSPADALGTSRYVHTATLLGDGKVLVAGGFNSGIYLDSAEVYDPSSDMWSPADALDTAREAHTATLLGDGKVLVAGGYGAGAVSSEEVYDPSSDTWSPADSLSTPRGYHTATLLGDGKVLVAGGFNNNGSSLDSAEVYDPSSDTWSPVDSLSTARSRHTATLLNDGKVLVTGGVNNVSSLDSAEVYDPSTGTWLAAGSMSTARAEHTAVLLGNGTVLVAGGNNNGYLGSAEVYDPSGDMWSPIDPLSTARFAHTAILLGNGKVLVAGGLNSGVDLNSAELYYPPDYTVIATFPPNPTNVPTGDFTFTSSDPAATFECRIDGGAFAPCPAAFTTAALPDGPHTIDVRAKDPAGNVDPTPASYMWTVDTTPPDTDGDGLSDVIEDTLGTDPFDADSDDDGLPDGQEPAFDQDTDGDSLLNSLDPDSDGDGLFDGTELGLGCGGPDTDAVAGTCIPDTDGGATITDLLDADTDGGGVSDGIEDANHNGAVDSGETDPLLPADDFLCTTDADCGGPASGVVCDDSTPQNQCIPGCRGTGNGCPPGEVCTSMDATIGTCMTGQGGTGGAGGSTTTGGAGGAGGSTTTGGTGGAGGGTSGAPYDPPCKNPDDCPTEGPLDTGCASSGQGPSPGGTSLFFAFLAALSTLRRRRARPPGRTPESRPS